MSLPENPQGPLSPEAVHRRESINAELARLYPAVCVEGSSAREAFLRIFRGEDYRGDPETALSAAWLAMMEEGAKAPVPSSPVLHPCSLVEQLCYVRFWEIEFRQTKLRDALAYLESEGRKIAEKMRVQDPDSSPIAGLTVRCLVPFMVLERRVNLGFQGVTLAEAFRRVAALVGLAVRLLDDALVVCSEEVAAALDGNERHGYQAPLWELRRERPIPKYILSEEDQAALMRLHPSLADPIHGDQIHFNAHFLLYGTPETAWSLADRLAFYHGGEPMDESPSVQSPNPPVIPGLDEPAPEAEKA